MRLPKNMNLEELQTALKDLNRRLETWELGNPDISGRRWTNAGDGQAGGDYVTLRQLQKVSRNEVDAQLSGAVTDDGSSKGGIGYFTIQDEGIDLTQRAKLNFIGSTVTAVDDAGSGRTNVTLTTSGGGFNSNSETILFEDFTINRNGYGELGWLAGGGATPSVATLGAVVNHPGVLQFGTQGANLNLTRVLKLPNISTADRDQFSITDNFDLFWLCRPGAGGTLAEVKLRIGYIAYQADTFDPPTDGIYFEKLTTDTNWFAVLRKSNVQTRTTTGFAVANNAWQKLTLKRMDANTLRFSVDGSNYDETVLTNLPSDKGLIVMVEMVPTAGTVQLIDLDFFKLYISGLTR